MQCTYNATMRDDRATIVAVEKQRVLHIVSVCFRRLSYAASSAHAPNYVVICGLSGCITFADIIS